jgi:hypothetical protein
MDQDSPNAIERDESTNAKGLNGVTSNRVGTEVITTALSDEFA